MKIVRFLLFPFAILYDLITSIRNFFFNVGVFKQTSFKIPIIVVGNLSVGGTGKTPQIEYLIRLINKKSKIAVLSRGYKRKTKGFILVNKSHSVEDVGDEPLQYFKKFIDIDVAVDENRVEGVQELLKIKEPEVILLDDAYQHRKIKGSFYILLTKYDDLFIDDFLLPTGNLRENRNGAKRANLIIVTKCPNNLSFDKQRVIKQKLSKFNKEVYFTKISYADNLSGSHNLSLEQLKEFEVLLVTGIANPKPLNKFLSDKDIRFQHLKFKDHHAFSKEDIVSIENHFNKIKNHKKLILTTEKDFTRLEYKLKELSYLGIETSFLNEKHKEFDSSVSSHISENRR